VCIHFSCIAFTVLVAFILHFLQLAGITGLGGSFLLHKYRVYGVLFSSFYIILPVLLAVVGGVILFISGCIGCVVSNKKPSCGHGLFVYLLIIVWCVMGTTAALAYTNKGKVILDVDLAPLKDVFQNYSGNSRDPDTKAVNALQRELRCCVPLSCCNKNYHSCSGTLDSPQLLYNEGCQIKLEEKLLLAVHIIIIIFLVVLFLLVISVIYIIINLCPDPFQDF
uniref:Tetraspanin 37 n=1 Tax=Cyprinus carpio TaxID=7962 RepID=A0A8C1TSI9_CYPCA